MLCLKTKLLLQPLLVCVHSCDLQAHMEIHTRTTLYARTQATHVARSQAINCSLSKSTHLTLADLFFERTVDSFVGVKTRYYRGTKESGGISHVCLFSRPTLPSCPPASHPPAQVTESAPWTPRGSLSAVPHRGRLFLLGGNGPEGMFQPCACLLRLCCFNK